MAPNVFIWTVTLRPGGLGKTGTVTLTAKATDGSGKKASVKVKFVKYAQQDDGLAITNAPAEMVGGSKSITLKTNIGGIPALTNRTLTWEMAPSSLPYATVSAGGKLTTYPVAEPVTITVYAYAKENEAAKASATIRLMPDPKLEGKTQHVDLYASFPGPKLNNDTFYLDTGTQGSTLQLIAKAYGNDGSETAPELTWKSSSAKVASIDANGLVTAKKAGTVTITATAKDSGVKASFKLVIRVAVQDIRIREASEELSLRGGTKMTLHVDLNPNGQAPTNKKVVWSLDPLSAAYASISQKGVLKAKKLTGMHTVWVTVTSKEDEYCSCSIPVTLYPSVTAIDVQYQGQKVTTLTVSLAQAQAGVDLDAACRPTGADNGVTWKSGSTKVATVDENGVVTALKKGTVKITATATDGSKKKATITIKIV